MDQIEIITLIHRAIATSDDSIVKDRTSDLLMVIEDWRKRHEVNECRRVYQRYSAIA